MNDVGAADGGAGWLGLAITSTYRDLADFFLPEACGAYALPSNPGFGDATLDGPALGAGVCPGVENGDINGVPVGGGATVEEVSLPPPASALNRLIFS